MLLSKMFKNSKFFDLIRSSDFAKWSKLSFGCSSIDACSNGGIVTRGITEIYGEAGSGKTQILLQLSLTVQLPQNVGGLDKKCAYINTEGSFPSNRLVQLAQFFAQTYSQNENKFLDGIFIEHIRDSDKLLNCILNHLPNLIQKNQIGLVIIDSIGAIFRTDSDYLTRAKELRSIGHALLHLVDTYSCGVVCANQVTSIDDTITPCLGLAWSHIIRTRFKISKTDKKINDQTTKKGLPIRTFEVIYSPDFSNNSCDFLIQNTGVSNIHK